MQQKTCGEKGALTLNSTGFLLHENRQLNDRTECLEGLLVRMLRKLFLPDLESTVVLVHFIHGIHHIHT